MRQPLPLYIRSKKSNYETWELKILRVSLVIYLQIMVTNFENIFSEFFEQLHEGGMISNR